MPGGAAKYVRLESATYPDGRVVKYSYGSAGGIDDALGQVAAITDSAGTTAYAQYSYLGDGTIVKVEHPQAGLTLSFGSAADSGGGYAGLDQFGRVAYQKWTIDGTAVDEYQYIYGSCLTQRCGWL